MKSDRMQVLQMNVCSDQEVAQAVDFVKRTLKEPEGGVWGYSYFQHSWLFAVLMESLQQCAAVRRCCTWVSEKNCLAIDVMSTWEEIKTS